MAEFTVGNHDYRSVPIDAMTSIAVAAKLASVLPLFAEFAPSILKRPEQAGAVADAGGPTPGFNSLGLMSKIVSSMSDDTRNFVIAAIASSVFRKVGPEGKGIMPVWDKKTNKPFYADMTGTDLLMIIWHVIQENAEPFLSAFGIKLSDEAGVVSPAPNRAS